ncbi:TetR/AcrR family transcriptional regulator [Actinomadura keratinilytica]
MTRAEAKERNRRALLDAALEVVSRDGYRARLDEIVARAGLTTGAVYSLFGSKNGLVVALADDHLRPQYEKMGQAVPAGLGLLEAVDAFARHYRRGLDAPDARSALSSRSPCWTWPCTTRSWARGSPPPSANRRTSWSPCSRAGPTPAAPSHRTRPGA